MPRNRTDWTPEELREQELQCHLTLTLNRIRESKTFKGLSPWMQTRIEKLCIPFSQKEAEFIERMDMMCL